MAAPSKFTEETVDTLIRAIRAGLPFARACEVAGIAESTFYQWQAGDFPRGADKDLKAEFSEALTRARGQSALSLVERIQSATLTDWRAAAWLLERRFPGDWGKDAELLRRVEELENALTGTTTPTLRRVA